MKQMKRGLCLCLFFCLTFLAAVEKPPRNIRIEGEESVTDEFEIVVNNPSPLLQFVAEELRLHLKQVTGKECVIVREPREWENSIQLILGDNPSARAEGLDVDKLPEEGYYIHRKGNRIYLLGRDDLKQAPNRNFYRMWFKRSTLHAAYDFLERFCGVRLVFPGQMGTLYTLRGKIRLPRTIEIMERPDCAFRENSCDADWPSNGPYGVWHEPETTYRDGISGRNLGILYGRMQEFRIPFGHGLSSLSLIPRFSQTHPEYFALTTDGKRHFIPGYGFPGHLCFSSGVKEVIFEDMKAYFSNASPESRGMKSWNVNAASRNYFSLMPQDYFYWCSCEKCGETAPGGRRYMEKTPEGEQWRKAINARIWSFTVELAERIRKAGFRNAVVTQMAYYPYNLVPDFKLPDNLEVQIAAKGLGTRREEWKKEREVLKAWTEKLGRRVILWTYPGKHMAKANLKGVPAAMHRHMGEYFQYMRDFCNGAYLESESDFYIFNYLNYYVSSRVMWNLDTDVETFLKRHYREMYGAGADEMETFFNTCETLWCDRIAGNIVETSLGPSAVLPSVGEIWTKIYSPEQLSRFDRLFDEAECKTATEPEALKRVRFMRKQFLGSVKAAAEKFREQQEALAVWKTPVPGSIVLRPFKGDVCEVRTTIRISQTPDALIFDCDCEEPRLQDMVLDNVPEKTWNDSCLEFFLNPSDDRENYYHIAVNADGRLSDSACAVNRKPDWKWESGAVAGTVKYAGGWKLRMTIPKSSLGKINSGGFPANFGRHRALRGTAPGEIYYQWSPVPGRDFHAISRWGRLLLTPEKEKNLIPNGDFLEMKENFPDQPLHWSIWRSDPKSAARSRLDDTIFISGGQSLKLENVSGNKINAVTKIRVKPETKYRISFFMRCAGVGFSGKQQNGAGGSLHTGGSRYSIPYPPVTGTHGWRYYQKEFRTDKTGNIVFGLWTWNAPGSVWFDRVRLEEVD